MTIGQLKKVTAEAVSDINRLMKQLRSGEKTLGTRSELRVILENKNVVMVVAKEGQRIVGVATLYIQQKIGKRTSHIEDVVVDEEFRGQGLGKKLIQTLISAAKTRKVGTIHLTSRPERTAANALYKKLGFKLKKTNPYSLHL
jgi:ribosomal protein S18 acetylase RimI-like enzyme